MLPFPLWEGCIEVLFSELKVLRYSSPNWGSTQYDVIGYDFSVTYLLIGNYGVKNAGDDILRDYFLRRFPEIKWKVLSANPESDELPRFPAGIRSFINFKWIRTLSTLKKSDGVVFGGGSLFTDTESISACWIWFVHALFAWIFRKPIHLAFQGIGPFKTGVGESLSRWVVRHSSFISVRDEVSFERLKKWKKNTDVVQSFDPSILLLDRQKDSFRTNNVFTYIPRFSTSEDHAKMIFHALSELVKNGTALRVLSLQPDDAREHETCIRLRDALRADFHIARSLEDALGSMSGMCVITQRYHGATAAVIAGIPFVAIRQREGDKLDAFAKRCGCISVEAEELDSKKLLDMEWSKVANGVESVRQNLVRDAERGEEALKETINMSS